MTTPAEARALEAKTPKLVNAPPGYVWSWRGLHGLAHLVSNKHPFSGLLPTVCGRRVRGRGTSCASQVGGYSQPPCPECASRVKP